MQQLGKYLNPSRAVWIRNIIKAPALRYRDFRLLWLSTLFNSIGMLGEQVVLSWLVLELTDSPLMVGVALGLRMAPFFFFGIIGGSVADRVDRRHFMQLTNVGMAVSNAAIGVLILLDVAELWHIFLLTFIGGSLRATYQAAQQSFAYDVVGPKNVLSGLAFVALGTRIGGLAGALMAGSILARLGADVAYIVMAAGYVLTALALLPVASRGQSAPAVRDSVWENLKGYMREIRHNPALLMLTILTGAIEILGFSHQVLLPSLARDILKVGPEGLGIMSAFRAAGGILGIILISALGEVRRKGPMLLGVLYVFGALIVLLAFAPNFPLALLILIVVNSVAVLSDILSQSLMQLAVPNELRGRATGSWVLAVGTAPVGHVQIGALASAFGVAVALTANGLALIALAAVAAAFLPRLRKL